MIKVSKVYAISSNSVAAEGVSPVSSSIITVLAIIARIPWQEVTGRAIRM